MNKTLHRHDGSPLQVSYTMSGQHAASKGQFAKHASSADCRAICKSIAMYERLGKHTLAKNIQVKTELRLLQSLVTRPLIRGMESCETDHAVSLMI